MIEAFLVSLSTVAIAEMGDRTQLLSLVLAAKFRKPWQITAGVLAATIANHAAAGILGVWFGRFLTPTLVNFIVGASMIAMALWTLKPDKIDDEEVSGKSAFFTTLVSFFIAEVGDKTQIATIALAAAYQNLLAVVAGTTLGMMAANIPVIFLGSGFASRLPLRTIHLVAAGLFFMLGFVFLFRAFWH
jgi:putative Ca2+/H+ antiporter (TMEM165/GDT1 family)